MANLCSYNKLPTIGCATPDALLGKHVIREKLRQVRPQKGDLRRRG